MKIQSDRIHHLNIVIFFFPLFPQEDDGFVVYENHMSSSYEVGVGLKGSITRDSHFE